MDIKGYYERVKALSKAQGKTIEYVVGKAGLSLASYNAYRRRENLPRADESENIAKELDTSNTYLVTGAEPGKPDTSGVIQQAEKLLADLKRL
ncbi:MAG: helix-turn-helix domain-containing protein [Treponema sp.]|jgi:transcriptional regulator with XRE-family HTH domain|nr:helix-turn-helix domain-containing protein [Treponema sp.]